MTSKHPSFSYTLNLDPKLPEDVEIIARRNGEDSDRVCADLQELRDMIYERGEIEKIRMDDAFLLKFLRARFFKLENTYKLLRNYYRFRNANPELHDRMNPMKLISVGEYDVVSVAPFKDQYQRRILFYKVGNWQPEHVSINDILAATLVLLEMGSMEPVSQVVGGIGIFDFEAYSMSHLWYISPSVVEKILCLIISAVPQRTCEIHIINHGWVFDVMYQMFKPFLDDRMRKKIHFHGYDLESLHRYVPIEHLPAKYGGTLPDFTHHEWIDYITRNEPVIRELQSLGYEFDEKDLKF